MSTDMTRTRSKGFILPVALILMAFATTVLVAAGIMVQRTSSKLNSYSLLSDLRITSNNLVEGATMVLASRWQDVEEEGTTSWAGFDDFVSYVSSRGGYEGELWAQALSTISFGTWWVLDSSVSEFDAILDDEAFVDYSDKGAVVNLVGGKYSIIAWAEKAGVKRYSYGMGLTETLKGQAALRIGETPRVFHEVTTTQKNKNQPEEIDGVGDLINGEAIVLGQVNVSDENINLEQVFPLGLTASGITPEGTYSYTQIATDSTLYFQQLLQEHEDWLASLTRLATVTYPSPDYPEVAEDTLIPFMPNDSSESSFYLDFPTVAGTSSDVRYVEITYKVSAGTYTFKLYAPEDYQVNLVFYGDVVIGDANSDPLKVCYVNGQYNITAYGTITVNSQLMYGDFEEEFDDARTQGGKVNNQEITTWSKVKELLSDFAVHDGSDYLSLVAIGGDIVNTYVVGNSGKASHAIRGLAGDYSAFPKDGVGGSFIFPDIGIVVQENNKDKVTKLGQLFVFGSITAKQLGTEDQLSNIDNLFVSSPQDTTGGYSTNKRFVLVGLRAW